MISRFVWLIFFIFIFSLFCPAQDEPTPQPTETPVKIVTEEIRLNVTAQTGAGNFDPTVVKDDLLIVEDGVPQKIESLRRTTASVLLLLDTGGELYFAKNQQTTRETARNIAQNLSAEDFIAVMEYHDKILTVADWTTDRKNLNLALNRKLTFGKRSRLAEALNAAVEAFKTRPPENRHLVLITDGLESVAEEAERQKALQNLLAANVTVHVVSYTRLEELRAQKLTQRVKSGNIKGFAIMVAEFLSPEIRTARHRERVAGKVPTTGGMTNDQIHGKLAKIGNDRNSPHDQTFENSPTIHEDTQDFVIVETDKDWIEKVRKRREAWRASEENLRVLTEDTGGVFNVPETLEKMPDTGQEIARAIGAQYIVNYTPKRPISESKPGESRAVKVVPRRVGLKIQARQKIVIAGEN